MTQTHVDPSLDIHEIAADLAYQRLTLVNVVFYGLPDAGDRGWVLIDAGLPGCANAILRAADARFGPSSRPAAIIVTHAHFDHVGSLETLARRWDNVPIYAHPRETPFLRGLAEYSPPDPNGLFRLLPKGALDVSRWLHALPADGTVPEMPGWRWLATPGHTPGHVCLWREGDRVLIAGDAFANPGPEIKRTRVSDRVAAELTAGRLAALEPELAVPGHGRALRGEPLREALRRLADDFHQVVVPAAGRG